MTRPVSVRTTRRALVLRAAAFGCATPTLMRLLAACGGAAPRATPAPTLDGSTTATATPATPPVVSATVTLMATTPPALATIGPGPRPAASPASPVASSRAASPVASPTRDLAATASTSRFSGTLRYWVLGYQPGGGSPSDALTDAAVARFSRANPAIGVRVGGYSDDQAGFVALVQARQERQEVDLVHLPPDLLPLLARDKQLAPIDPYLTADDRAEIYPNVLAAVTIKEQAYAWPWTVAPVGLSLNLALFRERGVAPPGASWSYAAFVETARQLTFTRANGEQVYGYTTAVDPGLVDSWPFILGDGAQPLSPDRSRYTWGSPAGISGLQKLVDLALTHKVTPPEFGTQTVEEIAAGFAREQRYAMIGGVSTAPGYRPTELDLAIRPMPLGQSGRPVTAGTIGVIAVAAQVDDARVRAAMDLARYLTSGQVGQEVAGYYQAPGARRTVVLAPPQGAFSPFVEHCYIPPLIPEWPRIRAILHTQLQGAVLGQLSPTEALTAPEVEINNLLTRSQG